MFTGIVAETGTVERLEDAGPGRRIRIAARAVVSDAAVGDSIAVNGCCLTVTERTGSGFAADVMAETLRASALGQLREGDTVNLERPMPADGRFDGHVVQGHVDGVGTVRSVEGGPNATTVVIDVPPAVLRYCVPKGSVTIDGISLTVVDVDDDTGTLSVSIIPHTWEHTNLARRSVGDTVNLEADVLAKYVERLMRPPTDREGERAPGDRS